MRCWDDCMNEGILNLRERVSSSHKWAIYLLVDIDHCTGWITQSQHLSVRIWSLGGVSGDLSRISCAWADTRCEAGAGCVTYTDTDTVCHGRRLRKPLQWLIHHANKVLCALYLTKIFTSGPERNVRHQKVPIQSNQLTSIHLRDIFLVNRFIYR